MLYESDYYCVECDEGIDVPSSARQPSRNLAQSRRKFMGSIGVGATALVAGGAASRLIADDSRTNRSTKPAEELVRELRASLSDDQAAQLVFPWDHQREDGRLTRMGTYNNAILGKRLVDHLTAAQRELVERTVRAVLADDESWERITRYGKWDNSGSFERTGCAIFGDPAENKQFAWVFSGHHLTLRCDGDSEPAVAFGGPIYYGHIVGGYDDRNVYHYQTQQVQSVFDALDSEQQVEAIAPRNPGDRERGIRFPEEGAPRPGIAYNKLSVDQQELVESVMRTLLAPFREEDGDEVMQIVKDNGGMEKVHLAFYKDRRSTEENVRWHFWRLEGPGFIWNYRVLPHVHCYVNIAGME